MDLDFLLQPGWMRLFASKFDMEVKAARVLRNPARRIRFLLLLCGDIHPHPGPRQPRGPMDLSVGFAPVTSVRMQRCVDAFKVWYCEHLEISFDKLQGEPVSVGWALRAYGLYCFEHGLPRYLFVNTQSLGCRNSIRKSANILLLRGKLTANGRYMSLVNAGQCYQFQPSRQPCAWLLFGNGSTRSEPSRWDLAPCCILQR